MNKPLLRWDEIDAPIRLKLPDLEQCKLNDLKSLIRQAFFIMKINAKE